MPRRRGCAHLVLPDSPNVGTCFMHILGWKYLKIIKLQPPPLPLPLMGGDTFCSWQTLRNILSGNLLAGTNMHKACPKNRFRKAVRTIPAPDSGEGQGWGKNHLNINKIQTLSSDP